MACGDLPGPLPDRIQRKYRRAVPPRAGEIPPAGKGEFLSGRTRLRGSCQPAREYPRAGDRKILPKRPATLRHAPPFAMLPCGVIRYQGAPADLRDTPLSTANNLNRYLFPKQTFHNPWYSKRGHSNSSVDVWGQHSTNVCGEAEVARRKPLERLASMARGE
ncbi:hypothetical protein Q31a_14810 [Aureliella helgolandensis]|uniref:Uncharacterized protein n=1 Tax=Aureliella helgolandensis TaxID=2527968 RepID=A0A518G3K9_9BACT|nr:hypothetical protein Q31a_14810 [Aureliella helgolandensis]